MAFQNKPPQTLRIASFLPAATEMVYALGLEENLVAVTHECDHPREARAKPVVVRSALSLPSQDPSLIDQAVRERASRGESLYILEEALLQALAPDLILTQDLCQVCAPSGQEASKLLKSLDPIPDLLTLTPRGFEDILEDFLRLGERTGTRERASGLVALARERVEKVRSLTTALPSPRVFFLEWVDPLFCAGHWIAEMVAWAGGIDPLSRPREASVRVPWEEVIRLDPEVVLVAPCGFNAHQAWQQAGRLQENPGWGNLTAVKKGKVFAVDGNAYFARPSLRLVEGIELLAHLFHPQAFHWTGPVEAYRRL